MMTLRQFSLKPETIPASTSWYLADLSEARGRQELFTHQAPQRLKVLRKHALFESTISSNRMEGVQIDESRIHTIVLGRAHSQNISDAEIRGYRYALRWIHQRGDMLAISDETIRKLHRLVCAEIRDAGRYKRRDSDIIERDSDGTRRLRFKTVPAAKTSEFVRSLVALWQQCLEKRWVHPLIALAAFNLDFLCIHPFRDCNGRVSRLLLLLQCYHLGLEVGRYISLERVIEQNLDRYYETLAQSSQRWHKGRHDPWPYVNYVLFILKTAYREFEERLGQIKRSHGVKTEMVEAAINAFSRDFTLMELERSCPGVGRDMVRWVLRDLQNVGRVECLGRGPGAVWRKKR